MVVYIITSQTACRRLWFDLTKGRKRNKQQQLQQLHQTQRGHTHLQESGGLATKMRRLSGTNHNRQRLNSEEDDTITLTHSSRKSTATDPRLMV